MRHTPNVKSGSGGAGMGQKTSAQTFTKACTLALNAQKWPWNISTTPKMIDNQELKAYYTSFMENMYHVEHELWLTIRQRTITKADFVAAMRRWAQDVTSK
jgi:hypothetical protein